MPAATRRQPIVELEAIAPAVDQAETETTTLPDRLLARCAGRGEARAQRLAGRPCRHHDQPGRRWRDALDRQLAPAARCFRFPGASMTPMDAAIEAHWQTFDVSPKSRTAAATRSKTSNSVSPLVPSARRNRDGCGRCNIGWGQPRRGRYGQFCRRRFRRRNLPTCRPSWRARRPSSWRRSRGPMRARPGAGMARRMADHARRRGPPRGARCASALSAIGCLPNI